MSSLNNIEKGLYLENLEILIPWKTSLDDISLYGNPEIKVLSPQRTDAIWRNASIFGGLTLDLTAMFWETLFRRNKFYSAHAYIDGDSFTKYKPFLDYHFHQQSRQVNQNSLEYYYKWKMNKCSIKLGKGDRFGEYYYIQIDRKII